MLCRGMLWADQSAPLLVEWVPEEAVEYIHIAIRFLCTCSLIGYVCDVGKQLTCSLRVTAKNLCERCVHGCPCECAPLGNDSCMVKLSPYHAPCLTVTAPTKPFLGSTTPTIPFTVEFQTGAS